MTTLEQRAPVEPGTAEWDELVRLGIRKDADRNWTLGDAALRITPMGKRGMDNGAGDNLAAYAEAIGIDAGTLRNYRTVADAWPNEHRCAFTCWKVHSMFTSREDRFELIEADGPGVRITVTRAHDLLGQRSDGRTGPRSTPEAKAAQAARSLSDPRVLADVLRDPEVLSALIGHPAIVDALRTTDTFDIDTLDVDEGTEQDAESLAELERIQEKLAERSRQLYDAEKASDELAKGGRATKRELTKAKRELKQVQKLHREADEKYAKYAAELEALRSDPERVKRATSHMQCQWVRQLLSTGRREIAEVDNKLDEEPSVMEGDDLGVIFELIGQIEIRLTSIKSKIGQDFTVPDTWTS